VTPSKSLVSIGMAMYNGERLIRQALDSGLGQTDENLEVIISENASTDNTGTIYLEYAARDQQKPRRRARQRDEAAIARWRTEAWPAIQDGRKRRSRRSFS
jgi:glycosyltransferase involved in cell wall biosynthesis